MNRVPGAVGKRGAVPEIVGVHAVGRIRHADPLVQVRAARMQRDAHIPARAEHLFLIADLHVRRAVRVRAEQGIDRRNGRHRVAVRAGIPLDAAADPSTAHRDHARLDHAVAVKHFDCPVSCPAPNAVVHPVRGKQVTLRYSFSRNSALYVRSTFSRSR